MVVALEPEEGKAKFYHEVCYCFTKIIVPFFFFFYRKLRVIGGRRQWQPTPVLLTGKSHGQRSLVGCSPWVPSESDKTEQLHFHFSLSCIGEGNGNPLQYSCLENPRDGRAWWAAIYGVAQSRTRLKRLSSSSSPSSESLVMAQEFLFLVAFNIHLQNGNDKYNERIQRQNNNPGSY